jgi:hypothetical protein
MPSGKQRMIAWNPFKRSNRKQKLDGSLSLSNQNSSGLCSSQSGDSRKDTFSVTSVTNEQSFCDANENCIDIPLSSLSTLDQKTIGFSNSSIDSPFTTAVEADIDRPGFGAESFDRFREDSKQELVFGPQLQSRDSNIVFDDFESVDFNATSFSKQENTPKAAGASSTRKPHSPDEVVESLSGKENDFKEANLSEYNSPLNGNEKEGFFSQDDDDEENHNHKDPDAEAIHSNRENEGSQTEVSKTRWNGDSVSKRKESQGEIHHEDLQHTGTASRSFIFANARRSKPFRSRLRNALVTKSPSNTARTPSHSTLTPRSTNISSTKEVLNPRSQNNVAVKPPTPLTTTPRSKQIWSKSASATPRSTRLVRTRNKTVTSIQSAPSKSPIQSPHGRVQSPRSTESSTSIQPPVPDQNLELSEMKENEPSPVREVVILQSTTFFYEDDPILQSKSEGGSFSSSEATYHQHQLLERQACEKQSIEIENKPNSNPAKCETQALTSTPKIHNYGASSTIQNRSHSFQNDCGTPQVQNAVGTEASNDEEGSKLQRNDSSYIECSSIPTEAKQEQIFPRVETARFEIPAPKGEEVKEEIASQTSIEQLEVSLESHTSELFPALNVDSNLNCQNDTEKPPSVSLSPEKEPIDFSDSDADADAEKPRLDERDKLDSSFQDKPCSSCPSEQSQRSECHDNGADSTQKSDTNDHPDAASSKRIKEMKSNFQLKPDLSSEAPTNEIPIKKKSRSLIRSFSKKGKGKRIPFLGSRQKRQSFPLPRHPANSADTAEDTAETPLVEWFNADSQASSNPSSFEESHTSFDEHGSIAWTISSGGFGSTNQASPISISLSRQTPARTSSGLVKVAADGKAQASNFIYWTGETNDFEVVAVGSSKHLADEGQLWLDGERHDETVHDSEALADPSSGLPPRLTKSMSSSGPSKSHPGHASSSNPSKALKTDITAEIHSSKENQGHSSWQSSPRANGILAVLGQSGAEQTAPKLDYTIAQNLYVTACSTLSASSDDTSSSSSCSCSNTSGSGSGSGSVASDSAILTPSELIIEENLILLQNPPSLLGKTPNPYSRRLSPTSFSDGDVFSDIEEDSDTEKNSYMEDAVIKHSHNLSCSPSCHASEDPTIPTRGNTRGQYNPRISRTNSLADESISTSLSADYSSSDSQSFEYNNVEAHVQMAQEWFVKMKSAFLGQNQNDDEDDDSTTIQSTIASTVQCEYAGVLGRLKIDINQKK